MRVELPTGTVTFLFTDIEGSTRLLQELGDGYAEVLAEHHRVLREVWSRHRGVEVDTAGDAFFVAFARASDAVAAAGDLASAGSRPASFARSHRAPHRGPRRSPSTPMSVWMCIARRGSRLAATADRCCFRRRTADLVGADVRDLGLHRLKDLTAAERLFQLGTETFPPLKTLHETNLPVPATAFLGREEELGEIAALLERPDVRLLTLSGPGGSGRGQSRLTRGGRGRRRLSHGVWWVPLASLADHMLVGVAAAQALGAKDALPAVIGDKRLLLLLDNFEHLLDAAPLDRGAVASCARLTVLVDGPPPRSASTATEFPVDPLQEREAVELFRATGGGCPLIRGTQATAGSRDLPAPRIACRSQCELAAARARAVAAEVAPRPPRPRLPLLAGGSPGRPGTPANPPGDDRLEPRIC